MPDRDIERWAFGAMPLLLAASAFCISGCGQAAPDRPDVLLVSVDTLRADHVGSYGHRLDTTPNLDRLAASGVRFDDATVQSPKTWPSMASMLTSTYPATNGVRILPRRPLPAASLTLAETLREAGYRTGAVVANVNLGREFAFDQGFDLFVESWLDELFRQSGRKVFKNAPGRVKRYTNATIVTDQGIELLAELSSDSTRPFFLWLHYIDPHGPYVPPPGYERHFAATYPQEPVPLDRIPEFQHQSDPRTGAISRDVGFYKAQYDREIRYWDDQLGRLLSALDARDLRAGTLIVVTADHGESLGEHDHFFRHGPVPYQTNARVPLVLSFPDRLPAGRVVETPVGLIDLMPTILETLGIAVPESAQGGSFLSLASGADASGPPVFMESGGYEPWQLSVRRGAWKLVHLRAPEDRAWMKRREIELYDLTRDPDEIHDVADQHPDVVRELQHDLAEWMSATPEYEGSEIKRLRDLDAQTQELLEALGYLDEVAPGERER